jgi:hypothetical protein
LPKSKIAEIYKKVSVNKKALELPQLKEALPYLGLEYAKNKTREVEARLSEIKTLLEHPNNQVKLEKSLLQMINKNRFYADRKRQKQVAIPENID